MCLNGYFPPDNRVEKEARTLASAGHEIFLLCKRKQGQPEAEAFESIQLIRINRDERYKLWDRNTSVRVVETISTICR
jgi:hypothetical protein